MRNLGLPEMHPTDGFIASTQTNTANRIGRLGCYRPWRSCLTGSIFLIARRFPMCLKKACAAAQQRKAHPSATSTVNQDNQQAGCLQT